MITFNLAQEKPAGTGQYRLTVRADSFELHVDAAEFLGERRAVLKMELKGPAGATVSIRFDVPRWFRVDIRITAHPRRCRREKRRDITPVTLPEARRC